MYIGLHVKYPFFFFFFNRHCNPCGLWPAQLSLSILSRKVFTEFRSQRHVRSPNLEDQWLERSNSRHQVSLTPETTRADPSKVELWARKLPKILPKVATFTSLLGSFTCRKFTTWEPVHWTCLLYYRPQGVDACLLLVCCTV